MQFVRRTLGVLLGLALLGALGVGGYFGVRRLQALFLRLDFQVAMVAAIYAVVLLLAAAIIAGSIRRVGAQGRDSQLHGSKVKAYRMFIGLWEELLRSGQGPESMARFSEQIRDVSHLLVLHGSSKVVRAHKAMQDLSLPEARAQFGDSLLQIRKDLGLESDSLPAQDLVHLLLSTGPENRRPLRVRRPPG